MNLLSMSWPIHRLQLRPRRPAAAGSPQQSRRRRRARIAPAAPAMRINSSPVVAATRLYTPGVCISIPAAPSARLLGLRALGLRRRTGRHALLSTVARCTIPAALGTRDGAGLGTLRCTRRHCRGLARRLADLRRRRSGIAAVRRAGTRPALRRRLGLGTTDARRRWLCSRLGGRLRSGRRIRHFAGRSRAGRLATRVGALHLRHSP